MACLDPFVDSQQRKRGQRVVKPEEQNGRRSLALDAKLSRTRQVTRNNEENEICP